MSSSDKEMISLNLSEKSIREYPTTNLRCPNCGSPDYWEKRVSTENDYYPLAYLEEYNKCNVCKTRFNYDGEVEAPYHEVKGISAVLLIMVVTLALVIVVGLII